MAKQRRTLNGRVVAITGGARGIGKATAEALARRGARLAIGDVDLATAEQTAAGLGGGSIALALDVTDRASFEGFLDEAERRLGRREGPVHPGPPADQLHQRVGEGDEEGVGQAGGQ